MNDLPGVQQERMRGPMGSSYVEGNAIGEARGVSNVGRTGMGASEFDAVLPVFEATSRMVGASSTPTGFFSTADTNLMLPAARMSQDALQAAGTGSTADDVTIASTFSQSDAINRSFASNENKDDAMRKLEANFFDITDNLLARNTAQNEVDKLDSRTNGISHRNSDIFASIEDQLLKSGSVPSQTQIPMMLGSFQHPDFAGADPVSVGIDLSGMSTEVTEVTARLLGVGQPMMSKSMPPDAFFQLNLAMNPRVFENAPLTQTVKKNGTARQDATGYIGYPQELRIPLSDVSDTFNVPYAPYAQDMYLSDLLTKLEKGQIAPSKPRGLSTTTAGMTGGAQSLLDLNVFYPRHKVYQDMETVWGDGNMVSIDDNVYQVGGLVAVAAPSNR